MMATHPDLVATDLVVRYGGRVALDHLSLRAPAGSITGLIGPNGAGKTTTFNAITGVVAAEGAVRLGEHRLDKKTAVQRAQCGLGRTFQRMQLFDTMTVAQNVTMGREMVLAGRHRWSHLIATHAQLDDAARHGADAISRCGIEGLANAYVGDLSTGQRRLVELTRAIAGGFDFLLLDEPASGLDPSETSRFGAVLRDIAEHDGIGILLVEHDMSLVRATCSTLYVLDFGTPLLEGPADEVLASSLLRDAYLGSDTVEAAV